MEIFNKILGKTIVKIHDGTIQGGSGMAFEFDDKSMFKMVHYQDCCEDVYIESIAGDLEWLIGKPLLVAEEIDGEIPENHDEPDHGEIEWTFYKFGTNNGMVTIRWYGTSNGYYCTRPYIEYS